MLLGLQAREGLPLVILRPGLVVGRGTSPFHSGLGFFNGAACLGWKRGRNPLPFVLVEDVAAAILGALRARRRSGAATTWSARCARRARNSPGWPRRRRPLRFHPKFPAMLCRGSREMDAERLGGRARRRRRGATPLARPGRPFDCGDARRDLGWTPRRTPPLPARAFAAGL